MNGRLLLASVVIPLGLIIAAVPENTTRPYKLNAEELLNEVSEGQQFMSPDEIAQMIISNDPSLQLIDVRSAAEFEKFSLPNALNVPLENLLADEYVDILNQDIKLNVFYSNSSNHADQAWMITRQLGYRNNGLNYWVETIMNPEKPAEGSPNEEFAKYDFRKGASDALGGGSAVSTSTTTSEPSNKPTIVKSKKKKGVQGGC